MSGLKAPFNAPRSTQALAEDVQHRIDDNRSLFISPKPFTVAQLTAGMATRFPWRIAIVSNGVGNKFLAISNGTAFYYMEGTAV
jgi:hypothetical protein